MFFYSMHLYIFTRQTTIEIIIQRHKYKLLEKLNNFFICSYIPLWNI